FNASGDLGTGGQGLGGGQVSVLVVGLSHKSAPVAVLERAVVSGDTVTKLLRDVVQAEPVAEAFVVSTCNRVEVYADVDRFHAGVTAICELLARHCGVPSHELTQYLYVHYEDRAVSHLLAVAAGLDSMVVGEDQILGQVRSAVKLAAEHGTAGRVLGELGRLALRTGKRARAETAIGRAGLSLLSAAVELAAASLGPLHPGEDPLAGRDVLVVGAGSMSGLATATAARSGAASITVANRTRAHAERLAASVSTILEAELAAYQSAMDAARVAPTVVALRAKAAGVVDAELARLAGRLSADGLSGHALDEIAQTVRRVVDKLLHAPTVRVKELA